MRCRAEPGRRTRRSRVQEQVLEQALEADVVVHAVRSRTGRPRGLRLVAHAVAQGLEAAVEPGLGGPDGDVEDVGRLRERQVEVEVQHDDRALVDGQPAELPLEAVALGDVERR